MAVLRNILRLAVYINSIVYELKPCTDHNYEFSVTTGPNQKDIKVIKSVSAEY